MRCLLPVEMSKPMTCPPALVDRDVDNNPLLRLPRVWAYATRDRTSSPGKT